MDHKTESGLQLPAIHSNGTGKRDLQANLLNAREAIYQGQRKLLETTPHMRDYYIIGGYSGKLAFEKAMNEHSSRFARLEDVMLELYDMAEALDGKS